MAIRIIMQKLTLSLFFLFLAACAKNLEERAERGDVEAQYKLARQYQDSAQGDGYYDPADMQCDGMNLPQNKDMQKHNAILRIFTKADYQSP